MRTISPSRPRAQPPLTAQERDRRAFAAIQARIDIITNTVAAVGAEADRQWAIACARVAEHDALAITLFELTTSLARIERRLVQATSQPLAAEAAQ